MQIAHTRVVLNKANTSADSDSSTTPLTRTTQLRCEKPLTNTTDDAEVTQVGLWLIGEMQFENQGLESKSDSAGSACWCKTRMRVEMGSSVEARAQRRGLPRLLISTRLHKPWSISVKETNRASNATGQLWQSAHNRHGR